MSLCPEVTDRCDVRMSSSMDRSPNSLGYVVDGAEVLAALTAAARERILILDGAMGTQIQGLGFGEEHFRSDRHTSGCDCHLKGNNDLLTLTQAEAIRAIHLDYCRAGADIIETNTFSSTAIAQADYGLQALVYELNREGAQIAREATRIAASEDGRRRFVAGALGPTNRTASISPDVNNPGYRAVSFDDLRIAYGEQLRGLIDGGAEIILIETIFDTLNAKAAIFACEEVFAEKGSRLPVMISGTITDLSGRTLVGSDAHRLLALGAPRAAVHDRPQLRARRERHARASRRDRRRGRHLRLRLPQCRAAQRVRRLRRKRRSDGGAAPRLRRRGAPERGRRLLRFDAGAHPRHRRRCGGHEAPRGSEVPPLMRLSGLEPFTLTKDIPFVNVGERTNVTGSAKFRKLITAGDFAAALAVARDQVANGAQIIDVNMDEGLIDSEKAMVEFLNLVAAEPTLPACR